MIVRLEVRKVNLVDFNLVLVDSRVVRDCGHATELSPVFSFAGRAYWPEF